MLFDVRIDFSYRLLVCRQEKDLQMIKVCLNVHRNEYGKIAGLG
jgi:hypothetical protein